MVKKEIDYYTHAILNSYAILFFSQNRFLASILVLVSFFNPLAGIAGFSAIVLSLMVIDAFGFNKHIARSGAYTFNSLLLGLGFGTFFDFNLAFCVWLSLSCFIVLMLSINLGAVLSKYGLPILSLPFIFGFWLILIANNGFEGMGLAQKSSYLVFEVFLGNHYQDTWLSSLINIQLPGGFDLFFRSLSALLFQNSLLAGILIAIGILVHSRIALSLLILGFLVATQFNQVFHVHAEGLSNYHLGANFMMMSLAIGGFFLIPSARSFLFASLSVVLSFLVINGFSRILGVYNLPILSLPFCFLTLSLLYFLMLRSQLKKLILTPIQLYSPEINLYRYKINSSRIKDELYFPISLPFMGTWTVSQDYHGEITHQGDWAQALDFVITDLDGQTYAYPGNLPEHYYCYNKPVLACADGWVQEVIQHVEDNRIGQVNLEQNWGNTIIIKHGEGLFSKVSHLKQNSAKVKVGDYVKQGELIALCGSSGRSPEPHLHFQIQAIPYVGAKTMAYPFAYYQQENELRSFTVPTNGDKLAPLESNSYLKSAFNVQPSSRIRATLEGHEDQIWEVFTDALNHMYLYDERNNAYAYFVKNQHTFYFTNYYGSKNTLLYYFYKGAYRINFSCHEVNDDMSLENRPFSVANWLQDFLAPFYIFSRKSYKNSYHLTADGIDIHSSNYQIYIDSNGLKSFSIQDGKSLSVWSLKLI